MERNMEDLEQQQSFLLQSVICLLACACVGLKSCVCTYDILEFDVASCDLNEEFENVQSRFEFKHYAEAQNKHTGFMSVSLTG
jgi:hypothetical protein